MKHSENINELAAALSAFQAEMPSLFKSDTVKVTPRGGGREYSFKYVPLEAAVEAVRPILGKHGLAVSQLLGDATITTLLMHKSGQYLYTTTSYKGRLDNLDRKNEGNYVGGATSQEEGGLITYYSRYAYMRILGLVGDDDDDSNAVNGNTYTRESKPAAVRTPSSSDGPPRGNADTEKEWLNAYNKAGVITKQGEEIVAKLQSGELTMDELADQYKISKDTRTRLQEVTSGVSSGVTSGVSSPDKPAAKFKTPPPAPETVATEVDDESDSFGLFGDDLARISAMGGVAELQEWFNTRWKEVPSDDRAEFKKVVTPTVQARLKELQSKR
jgi:ERF superfamily.